MNCKILVTSRCNISQYETVKIAEPNANTELTELFYKHCPSSKASEDVVKEIIQTVGCHTLTVCLAAESIIGNAVGTDNDYVKTTYRHLNNLYARWNKPEKAIEYRDKYFSNRITTNKVHYKED